jgi:trigger factor
MGGAAALRAEALREALPDFYSRAIQDAEVDPIAPPQIDITAGEESGPVSFDAVVQVRPVVSIAGYDGLVVEVPSTEVSEEEVQAQLDRMRENDGELITAERKTVTGDYATIDLHATDPEGKELIGVDDYLYEVGTGTVVPELDEQLSGARAGEVLAFTTTIPDGTEVSFRVLVKLVQWKKLPDATDEWAKENSEFETAAELRDQIRGRIERVKILQSQLAVRDKTLEALVELVDDEEVPEILIEAEVRERIHDLQHRLEQQHVGIEQFLEATGRTADGLVASLREESLRAVKGDLALRALGEAEEIVVSEEELNAEIATMAERMKTDPDKLRSQLDHGGRTAAVRSELRKMQALSWLIDHVELVDEQGKPVSREGLTLAGGDVEGGEGAESSEGIEGQEASATEVDAEQGVEDSVDVEESE